MWFVEWQEIGKEDEEDGAVGLGVGLRAIVAAAADHLQGGVGCGPTSRVEEPVPELLKKCREAKVKDLEHTYSIWE